MPVKFLDARWRLPRLGRVRLGHKEEKKKADGKTVNYPKADPFFILPEDLAGHYPPQPATLHVRFLSDDMEVTFPYYLRFYQKSGLRCLGDGEQVLYGLNDDGTPAARDGLAVSQGKFVQEESGMFRKAPCLGDACPRYVAGECKPTGFLRFVVEENLRQGYYDMVCHQRAVVGIRTQLVLCLQMFGRLTDIPFLLHRGEEEQVPVKTPKGVVDMPVRTQWVEIDPAWFQANFMRRQEILAESARVKAICAPISVTDLYGQDTNGDEAPATVVEAQALPAAPQFAEALYDEEGEPDDEFTGDPEPQPESPPEPPAAPDPPRPARDPEQLRKDLTDAARSRAQPEPITTPQIQLLNSLLSEALDTPEAKARHLCLSWLWQREVTSAKQLSKGRAAVMIDWLSNGSAPSKYVVSNRARAELFALHRQAQVDAGQTVMEEVAA